MPAFNSIIPSGSTDGRMIEVAATSTPGTELHTAVSGTNHMDEVYVWAVNSASTDRKLTIELGGVTSTDDLIEQTIPAESGLMLVVPGIRLQNGVVVRAFAASGDKINCAVNVNRIIQVESE